MKYIQTFALILSFFLSPINTFAETSKSPIPVHSSQIIAEMAIYLRFLEIVKKIEKDTLTEDDVTPEEWEVFKYRFKSFAKRGFRILGEDFKDIALQMDKLFEDDPNELIYYDDVEAYSIILCGNFFKHPIKKTGKFLKKYKKEIIIAVTVAATVTGVILINKYFSEDSPPEEPYVENENEVPQEPPNETPQEAPKEIDPLPECNYVKPEEYALPETITNESSPMQEIIETTVGGYAQEFLGMITHELIDESANFLEIFPALLEEIQTIGEKVGGFLNISTPSLNYSSPMENFDRGVEYAHKYADKLFNTDEAHLYGKDAFEGWPIPQMHIGIIPFPTEVAGNLKIARTLTNNIRGWKIGTPINNLTKMGKPPKWNTVRKRYWKNRVVEAPQKYKVKELERMKKGLAPQRVNEASGLIESMELHHIPPQRIGGMYDVIELWPVDHAKADEFRRLKR